MKRWINRLAVFAIVFAGTHFSEVRGAEPARLDMQGHIKNEVGEPVPNATVLVVAAGPRKGSNPRCPYNYPDCGKKALTDAEGNYRINSLDPEMDFYVVALAAGYAPSGNSKLKPESGPILFKLKPRNTGSIPEKRQVAGRIIGPDGEPIEGAVLSVEGVARGNITYWSANNVDSLSVTDENGEYHIAGTADFDKLHVVLSRPGLAQRWVNLEPGKMQLLRMSKGVTVSGRLSLGGKPLAGVELGMSTSERASGEHLSGYVATTDAAGRFRFECLPPGAEMALFSHMDSFKDAGASLLRRVTTSAGEQPMDLGEVEAQSACRIKGRVVLADGKPIPPNTRLLLSRSDAWDSTIAPLDGEGSFEVAGVPKESLSISLSLNGYRFSPRNPNVRPDLRGLSGRMTKDLENFVILLEPGKQLKWGDYDQPSFEEERQRRDRELSGFKQR